MIGKGFRQDERGTTIAEFAVVAGVFFMIIFGIMEFGRLLYTHNALTDAARRGARYAVINEAEVDTTATSPKDLNSTCVKNVVIYGETHIGPRPGCAPIGPPLINGLETALIETEFTGADLDGVPSTPNPYGTNLGTATVTIRNFTFNLSIPLLARPLTMPIYTTTLTAESAGYEPDPL
ncbi:MAG: TadE/TadG family type IV pilus assembly protein [Pyrinomonadaceae bacterium]